MDWAEARTLGDFGECVALWLEGRLSNMPTVACCDGISAETKRLVPLLAAVNRRGNFVTTDSQPGCTAKDRPYGGDMTEQRAAVSGFVPPGAVSRVRSVLGRLDGVTLLISRPGARKRSSRLLVSRWHGKDATWFGYVMSRHQIREDFGGLGSAPGLHPQMIKALEACCQVTVVDTVWGRNTLWPLLKRL